MLGDVLKREVKKLADSSVSKSAPNSFWVVLRNIAKEEIIEYGGYVDSTVIIPIYYEILLDNIEYIPEHYREQLPSNNQERFRVVSRNMFSSNAFHPDGLANQEGIVAYKETNENIKGERIVFRKK